MGQENKVQITARMMIVSLALVLSNLRATMFVYLYPDTTKIGSPAWVEILLWVAITMAAVRDMHRNNLFEAFVSKWRRNWVLAVFVFLALLSTFWSTGISVTLYRSLELLFATLVASYIGLRYLPGQIMEFLFWFGVVLLIVSIAIVYSAPATGTMDWEPYNGAWRGIYWNRNHLASIAALLNAVFLCRLINAMSTRIARGLLDGVFYLFSLVTLYNTRSATGFILVVTLHIFVFTVWLWIKISDRLKKRHYVAIAGVALAGVAVLLTNLDLVFGLFNRSTTLTGRTQLWQAILNHAVAKQPWLGHGFGAAWNFESFRVMIMQKAGWAAQPLIGDNGYIDILLHVGAVGLGVFLVVIFTLLIRSVRYGISQKTLTGFFPMLIVLYALIANISFSLFAETEVFVWLLLVSALFIVTPGNAHRSSRAVVLRAK